MSTETRALVTVLLSFSILALVPFSEGWSVQGTGDNSKGQLGTGDKNGLNVLVPEVVLDQDVKAIAAGQRHSLFLTHNGTLLVTGLAFGTTNLRPVPVCCVSLQETNSHTILQISTRGYFSLVLISDGTLRAFGDNNHGQLGVNSVDPQPSVVTVQQGSLGKELTSAMEIAAGGYHSLVVLWDNSVKSWGRNDNGQLALGSNEDKLAGTVVPLMGVTRVFAGMFTSFFLKAGVVLAAGRNDYGQLGLDTSLASFYTANEVTSLAGNVVSVAPGGEHTLFLLEDGKVQSCGFNSNGQRGMSDTGLPAQQGHVLTLVEVQGATVTGVRAVAAGLLFSVMILADGTVVGAGANNDGQLGDGTESTRHSFTPAIGVSGAGLVSCAGEHTLLGSNGSFVAPVDDRWITGTTLAIVTDVGVAFAATGAVVTSALGSSSTTSGASIATQSSASAGLSTVASLVACLQFGALIGQNADSDDLTQDTAIQNVRNRRVDTTGTPPHMTAGPTSHNSDTFSEWAKSMAWMLLRFDSELCGGDLLCQQITVPFLASMVLVLSVQFIKVVVVSFIFISHRRSNRDEDEDRSNRQEQGVKRQEQGVKRREIPKWIKRFPRSELRLGGLVLLVPLTAASVTACHHGHALLGSLGIVIIVSTGCGLIALVHIASAPTGSKSCVTFVQTPISTNKDSNIFKRSFHFLRYEATHLSGHWKPNTPETPFRGLLTDKFLSRFGVLFSHYSQHRFLTLFLFAEFIERFIATAIIALMPGHEISSSIVLILALGRLAFLCRWRPFTSFSDTFFAIFTCVVEVVVVCAILAGAADRSASKPRTAALYCLLCGAGVDIIVCLSISASILLPLAQPACARVRLAIQKRTAASGKHTAHGRESGVELAQRANLPQGV